MPKVPGRKSRNASGAVFPQMRTVGDIISKDLLVISHEEQKKKKKRYVDEDDSSEKETSYKSKHHQ
jgi:hypothetical protein